MQLQQLRYFVAVAEHGSFTEAANHLYVAQPSVSQQIRQLEKELGVQLLDRSNRVVTPTDIGERLLTRARDILMRIGDTEREASDYSGLSFGTLRVGTTPTASRVLLPQTLPAFTATHPDVSIEIVEAGSLKIADMVRAGTLDLGLVAASARMPELYADFRTSQIASGEIACFISRDNPLSERATVALQSLRNERVIAFGENYLVHRLVLDAADWDISARIVYSTDNTDSVHLMVAAGLGITFSSSLQQTTIKRDERVRLVPLKLPRLPLDLVAISYGERYLPRAATLFLDSLKQLAND